jgi:hypothetical protein
MQSLAIVKPDMMKRASLLFEKIFIIDIEAQGPSLSGQPFDWIFNQANLKLDDPTLISRITEDQKAELFRALGRVAEAIVLSCRDKYQVIPILEDIEVPDGKTKVYIASLDKLPLPVEHKLSWEQVIEFRQDHEAAGNYRALRNWVNGLAATSSDHTKELIDERISSYCQAMEKHGIETVLGCFKSVYDEKFLKYLLTIAGGGTALAGPMGGLVAAAVFTAGKVAVELLERRVELIDLQRNSEAAIIYDASRLGRN